jgi:hypothetical protein
MRTGIGIGPLFGSQQIHDQPSAGYCRHTRWRKAPYDEVSTGSNEGLLLEPVNEKKDGYGFVYAPMRNSHDVYNPFKSASAYQK